MQNNNIQFSCKGYCLNEDNTIIRNRKKLNIQQIILVQFVSITEQGHEHFHARLN